MNTPRIVLLLLFTAGIVHAQAPATPDTTPAAGTEPAQTELQKWIATTDAQWQAAFNRDVVDAYAADLKKLAGQYSVSLDAALTKASAAGDLDGALALRNEQKRFTETNVFPEQDDAADAASVKQIRAATRVQLAKIEQENVARTKALHTKYDTVLAQGQAQLTQRGRLDDALLLKAKREEIAASWLTGTSVAASVVTQPKVPPATTVAPAKVHPTVAPPPGKSGTGRYTDATKDRPFENSLGMRFVPVPITGGPSGGQRVLFSIWETRVTDYEVFAKSKKREWTKPQFSQAPTHPIVKVSWDDAQAFCEWLTQRERQGGRLGTSERYRLPTDHEWSCAVGIGAQEDPAKTPEEKNGKIADAFPWGSAWPPPPGAGNYSGEEVDGHKIFGEQNAVAGYRDDFPYTAPVGSFAANSLGIFDLGGNAREWCEELFSGSKMGHVLRGACCVDHVRGRLLLSSRVGGAPPTWPLFGFRVVLAPAGLAR